MEVTAARDLSKDELKQLLTRALECFRQHRMCSLVIGIFLQMLKWFNQCSGDTHAFDKIQICLLHQISEIFKISRHSGNCVPKLQEHQ